MEFVILTFVLVVGIIGGSYWALVLRPEQVEEAALHGRIKKAAVAGHLTKALFKEPERLSDVGVIDRLLARSGQAVTPLQRMIEQSGLKITVGTLLLVEPGRADLWASFSSIAFSIWHWSVLSSALSARFFHLGMSGTCATSGC